jgi:hypothetical protein
MGTHWTGEVSASTPRPISRRSVMVTRRVLFCDRDGKPDAVTVLVLIDGCPRREDLCPECRKPMADLWERMPRPMPRNTTRRLQVVPMETVKRAARATRASRKPQTGS